MTVVALLRSFIAQPELVSSHVLRLRTTPPKGEYTGSGQQVVGIETRVIIHTDVTGER